MLDTHNKTVWRTACSIDHAVCIVNHQFYTFFAHPETSCEMRNFEWIQSVYLQFQSASACVKPAV